MDLVLQSLIGNGLYCCFRDKPSFDSTYPVYCTIIIPWYLFTFLMHFGLFIFISLSILNISRFGVFATKFVARRTELKTVWAVVDQTRTLLEFHGFVFVQKELYCNNSSLLSTCYSSAKFSFLLRSYQQLLIRNKSNMVQTQGTKQVVQNATFAVHVVAKSRNVSAHHPKVTTTKASILLVR